MCLTCPGCAEGPAEASNVGNAVLVGRQVLVPLLEVLLHDAIQPAAQQSVSAQAQLQQGPSAGCVTTQIPRCCAHLRAPASFWDQPSDMKAQAATHMPSQDRQPPATHEAVSQQPQQHRTILSLARPHGCTVGQALDGIEGPQWLSHLLVSFWYLLIPYSIFSGAYLQQRQL